MAAARVERRLAAILAADVVGYSRLMERDEDRTLERLKAHRQEFIEPLIAEYQGRTVKLMGDGALVEFASVVDAVRCAVLVQRGMAERETGVPEDQRLRFRIGINLGDVIREADGDLYGDGVNVAARLEQLAEPGGVVVSGTAYDHLQGKLDLPLEFAGEQRVKNIERLVRAYRVRLDGAAIRFGSRRVRRLGPRAVATALGLFLLGAAVAGGWWWRHAGEPAGPPLPDKPSIAVLPFDNLTDDERLGRLADGVVEDVTTDLSRFRDISVVARNSTFAYRGEAADVRRVGSELGARYVLAGSVQSSGDRLRLTAQLVDTTTGTHVWSDAHDRGLGELAAAQADVTERISAAVGGMRGAFRRTAASLARSRPPQDRDSYDLVLLGTEMVARHDRDELPEAMGMFRRALELDPSFQPAHVALALGHWNEVDHGWADWPQAMDAWLAEARQAVALDPGDAMAHVALGARLLYGSDFDGAAAEFAAAQDANRNDAQVLALVAGYSNWLEASHRPLELMERAARLDPSNAGTLPMVMPVYYFAGDHEKAVSKYMSRTNLGFLDFLYLAMSHGQLGRTDEARAAADLVLEAIPVFSAEWGLTHNGPFAPAAAANRALYLEGVDKAGLPLCATWEQLAREVDVRQLPECEARRAMMLHGFLPMAPDRRQRRSRAAGSPAPSPP